MNDRFLFRAFYEGRFIYKNLIDANYYTYDNKCIGLANTLPNSLKWEQCTGLKDKNGKLIYEGDIIKLQCNREDKGGLFYENAKVIYDIVNSYSGFCVQLLDGNKASLWRSHKMEIIGNIHENPELLEQSNLIKVEK